MTVDLHMHSTCSDGRLAPAELVRLCAGRGVRLMALTDHDEICGNPQAMEAAREVGIGFIPGVEVSTDWRGLSVHVVGLNIDLGNREFAASLQATRRERVERARKMGKLLGRFGVADAYERTVELCGCRNNVTRAHFARLLLHDGVVSCDQDAFTKYLGVGKPCYVPGRWPTVVEATRRILAAGGIPVIAHPGRILVKGAFELAQLFDEFTQAGGYAIEVSSGSQAASDTDRFAQIALARRFLASTGSDFHSMTGRRPLPGDQPQLPASQTPVWTRLGFDRKGNPL